MMIESINMVRQVSYPLLEHKRERMYESGMPALKRYTSYASIASQLTKIEVIEEEEVIFMINTCDPVEE